MVFFHGRPDRFVFSFFYVSVVLHLLLFVTTNVFLGNQCPRMFTNFNFRTTHEIFSLASVSDMYEACPEFQQWI